MWEVGRHATAPPQIRLNQLQLRPNQTCRPNWGQARPNMWPSKPWMRQSQPHIVWNLPEIWLSHSPLEFPAAQIRGEQAQSLRTACAHFQLCRELVDTGLAPWPDIGSNQAGSFGKRGPGWFCLRCTGRSRLCIFIEWISSHSCGVAGTNLVIAFPGFPGRVAGTNLAIAFPGFPGPGRSGNPELTDRSDKQTTCGFLVGASCPRFAEQTCFCETGVSALLGA